jgi:hypothetical protein
MKKMAVFVEGKTELLFVDALLSEIAGAHNILIDHSEIRGGATTKRLVKQIRASQPDTDKQFYVMLYDCGGDEGVKTRIIEEHERLTNAEYSKILGLRDVRPRYSRDELPRLERNLQYGIQTKLIPVHFILAIMEIEAWFLRDHTHLLKISPAITVDAVKERLGFDPSSDDLSLRPSPAEDLDACYKIGEKSYKHGSVERTIAALDIPYVYVELRGKIPYLDVLAKEIDLFLS